MMFSGAVMRKGARGLRPPGVVRRSPTASGRASQSAQLRLSSVARATAVSMPGGTATDTTADEQFLAPERPVRVLVAGGGIAGLVLAVSLLKKGVDVRIFERDMTAIRGEGKYRGPIQVQSNALAALEAIDKDMAAEIMAEGCMTGDRINGLCDGVSGDWYVKFDTYHPAVDNGLPVTRVISRVTLQQILAKYALKIGGDEVIQAESKVVKYDEDTVDGHDRVWAETQTGERIWGDVLIGADGIWSKVREQLIGHTDACYSGYTCYTGISDFVAPDIDTVAYRVFLGNGQYFVSSDVGDGKMQWYAFHEEKTGGKDEKGTQKPRLMKIFGKWNDAVTDLIAATPEDDVIRRDIYDRAPIMRWTKGRVALLGDSAHAMQPNLGQGGCMAIEDAYAFANIIAAEQAKRDGSDTAALDIPYSKALKTFQNDRMMRASSIHGMARMAAVAASTYKAYLGEQFHLEDKIKIPHPGRVAGRVVLSATMPLVLGWVLGGNTGKIKNVDRAGYCNIADKPAGFAEEDWPKLIKDDEALLQASQAYWVLVPSSASEEETGAVALENDIKVGSGSEADVRIEGAGLCDHHACIEIVSGKYYLVDRDSAMGSWLNGKKLKPSQKLQLHPGDWVSFGGMGPKGRTFKVKQMHLSQKDKGLLESNTDGSTRRYKVSFKAERDAAKMAAV